MPLVRQWGQLVHCTPEPTCGNILAALREGRFPNLAGGKLRLREVKRSHSLGHEGPRAGPGAGTAHEEVNKRCFFLEVCSPEESCWGELGAPAFGLLCHVLEPPGGLVIP